MGDFTTASSTSASTGAMAAGGATVPADCSVTDAAGAGAAGIAGAGRVTRCAPFVDIGSAVKKGQVLCIIEAMKLMNEIDSEYDGEIMNIYVENGQPVQYGERLFAIRTR